jgi:hypothetical protein
MRLPAGIVGCGWLRTSCCPRPNQRASSCDLRQFADSTTSNNRTLARTSTYQDPRRRQRPGGPRHRGCRPRPQPRLPTTLLPRVRPPGRVTGRRGHGQDCPGSHRPSCCDPGRRGPRDARDRGEGPRCSTRHHPASRHRELSHAEVHDPWVRDRIEPRANLDPQHRATLR